MEIKSKFEEINEVKPLNRPFVAVHKESGNVYLFHKKTNGEKQNIAILMVFGEYVYGSEVGQEIETTFTKHPDEWRVISNPTITVTEG